MFRHRFFLIVSLLLALNVAGCATIITTKANPNENPNGIRVFPPRVYLFVDKEKEKSQLIYLPDYGRAYDIKPLTFLAKQDLTVEFGEGGQVAKFTANQDTTAIIELLKRAAELAAKGLGVPVAKEVIQSNLGLESGIYRLEDDGTWVRVTR
jgi:hypothetical protein